MVLAARWVRTSISTYCGRLRKAGRYASKLNCDDLLAFSRSIDYIPSCSGIPAFSECWTANYSVTFPTSATMPVRGRQRRTRNPDRLWRYQKLSYYYGAECLLRYSLLAYPTTPLVWKRRHKLGGPVSEPSVLSFELYAQNLEPTTGLQPASTSLGPKGSVH